MAKTKWIFETPEPVTAADFVSLLQTFRQAAGNRAGRDLGDDKFFIDVDGATHYLSYGFDPGEPATREKLEEAWTKANATAVGMFERCAPDLLTAAVYSWKKPYEVHFVMEAPSDVAGIPEEMSDYARNRKDGSLCRIKPS